MKKFAISLILLIVALRIWTFNSPVPTYTHIFVDLAKETLEQGDDNKAEDLFRKSQYHNPESPHPYYYLGQIALKKNNWQDFYELTESLKTKASIPEPSFALPITLLGEKQLVEGNRYLAQKTFKSATFHYKYAFRAMYNLGKLSYQNGDLKNFDYYINLMVKYRPKRPDIHQSIDEWIAELEQLNTQDRHG